MKNQRKNIFMYFLQMLIVFIVIDSVITILPSIIKLNIAYNKYGSELLLEAIYALLVLVVMLLFKNSYVFTNKKTSFLKSIGLGFPILLIAGFSLLGSIASLDEFNVGNFFNLLFLTIFIGIAEEFLCRGWLQNEFIERYGDSKKHIILSILFSSLIFGLIHLSNLLNGQDLISTIMQVIQATSAGLLFGSIYYKTKNIWSVVFLHSVYDFSLMLSDLNLIKDCTYNISTKSVTIYLLFTSIILSLINIIGAILVMKRVQVNEKKKQLDKVDNKLFVTMISLFVILMLPLQIFVDGYDDYQVCYTFENREYVVTDIETHFPYYDEYLIDYTKEINLDDNVFDINYKFKFFINDNGKMEIRNINNDDFVELDYEDISSFEVIENLSSYLIVINSTSYETKIYYSNYVNKNNLSNTQKFLDEIKDSFKIYDVPLITEIGYMTLKQENYKYPLFISETKDKYIIDIDSNLYKVKYKK